MSTPTRYSFRNTPSRETEGAYEKSAILFFSILFKKQKYYFYRTKFLFFNSDIF